MFSYLPSILARFEAYGRTRKIGLEARRQFVQPIGAWFAQVGKLHQVIHMWHYDVCPSQDG